MTEAQFEEILALGHELPGIEFKSGGSRNDRSLCAKVVRAILGMANRRGGGRVIVGVEERTTGLVPAGVAAADVLTWRQDPLAGAVAAYAEPYVELHSEVVLYKGHSFIVVEVEEFEEVPVLCKKDFPEILRGGACYVRRRGRVETSEIPSQGEMRALLELATEKRVRHFMEQAHRAGIKLQGMPSDEQKFDDESGDFE